MAYPDQQRLGRIGVFITTAFFDGCQPITDRLLQFSAGDLIRYKEYWEVKCEQRWTGNFFIEERSNRHKKPGWVHNLTNTDCMVYIFLDRRIIYRFDYQIFKQWYFHGSHHWPHVLVPREYYRWAKQEANEQKNESHGCLLPISVLEQYVPMEVKSIPDRIYGDSLGVV